MGLPTPMILKVIAPEYGKVVIEASNGKRYYSDLSSLSLVYCYPKTKADWGSVHTDSAGLALMWSTRFEVHVDQVIGLAYKIEDSSQSA